MKEILRLGIILLLIAGIAGAVLSGVNVLTVDKIAAAELYAKSSPEVANAVCPGSTKIENSNVKNYDESKQVTISEANESFEEVRMCRNDAGDDMAYAITTLSTVDGYGGEIEIIVGINFDGEITGLKVTSHSETPGLGANITTVKFQDQFIGLNADTELVASKVASGDGEIQSLSGATYSSKSFTSAINNAFEIYNEYLK